MMDASAVYVLNLTNTGHRFSLECGLELLSRFTVYGMRRLVVQSYLWYLSSASSYAAGLHLLNGST